MRYRDTGRQQAPIACILFLMIVAGCVTAQSAQSRGVLIVRTALQKPPAPSAMPSECKLVNATPPVSRSEFDLDGQHHPFRDEQDRAAKAGANLLLVRSRVVVSRRDLDCPATSPITDCPATLGAWFDVVFERYACPDNVAKAFVAAQSRRTAAAQPPD